MPLTKPFHRAFRSTTPQSRRAAAVPPRTTVDRKSDYPGRGNIFFRRPTPNSPVFEIVSRNCPSPLLRRNPRIHSIFSNANIRIKLVWSFFVFLVCLYASSRYDGGDAQISPVMTATAKADQQQVISSAEVRHKQVVPSSTAFTPSNGSNASLRGEEITKRPTGSSMVCSRKLPFDLFDQRTWPTPYTPSYFEKEPIESKEVILLKNDAYVDDGSLRIRSFNEFFESLDLAYDKKCPVFITKDAKWIWDALLPPFFGPNVEKNGEFWIKMQSILGVTIVDNEADPQLAGKSLHVVAPKTEFQFAGSDTLSPKQIRNRRDTIFRNLFQQSREGVCTTITLCGFDNSSKRGQAKYVVIELSPKWSKGWQSQFNEVTGRDHTAAFQMTPEYVKAILKPLKLHAESLILMGDHSKTDDEEIKRIVNDPELNIFNTMMEAEEYEDGDTLHLAILADAYIADPTSHWSLLIARMRYALGLRNTFVLTEKKMIDGEERWVSYIDDENYLELYDKTHLGPWMG
ncbi:hypothetical protein HJC23_009057 [Cyclotella cryptica]|uniref:Uncharacterized protein n=1 Tax=Cyclotella cryptica TaxID=29204 RepID=A0ABD3RAJ7_9STRA|eukprot:CCRYP_000669-RA/>CCRYP_000669-RA protein AED:0.23 eAED:0.23 QI:72/-1/1/1/-1/1/1/183/514